MSGPLVYIEYISRRPGVSLEAFHALAGHGQTGWGEENPEEVLLANLGRTWRTGPEPEYLAFWYTPGQGLDRFDDWERIFRSGDADEFEEPFKIAARIDRAGSYDPLIDPKPVATERVYIEFFDIAEGATHDEVRSAYEQRAGGHPELELFFVLDRIGRLGPDPRGLAVWGLPSWAHLEEIARDLDGVDAPVRLVNAGMYSEFGKETL
jgi:hypothetical protein